MDKESAENKDQTPTNDSVNLKSKAFDSEFCRFVQQARETINSRYSASISIGNVPVVLSSMERFFSLYKKMTPAEYYRYFETLYGRKRADILNWLKDDRWIRTGGIEIQFGDGIKGAKELREIKIMLSDVFLVAYDLRETAEKVLIGLDEEMVAAAQNKDLIRPQILMLHMMRIFYHLIEGNDKARIGDIVTQIEMDLGMETRTVNKAEEIAQTAQAAATSPAATGGLSSLFTMATSMMEKMGYKPPPGMKPPTEGEIGNVINSVFGNPTTQNALQGMFSSLHQCQDFGSAMQTVVQNVTDPKTMEAIQASVSQTAQIAAQTPGVPGQNIPPVPSDVPKL
jgi:hypothetical protein